MKFKIVKEYCRPAYKNRECCGYTDWEKGSFNPTKDKDILKNKRFLIFGQNKNGEFWYPLNTEAVALVVMVYNKNTEESECTVVTNANYKTVEGLKEDTIKTLEEFVPELLKTEVYVPGGCVSYFKDMSCFNKLLKTLDIEDYIEEKTGLKVFMNSEVNGYEDYEKFMSDEESYWDKYMNADIALDVKAINLPSEVAVRVELMSLGDKREKSVSIISNIDDIIQCVTLGGNTNEA